MVASCRGNLSFRRTACKATPVRLGDQAPGQVGWGRIGLNQTTGHWYSAAGIVNLSDTHPVCHSCGMNASDPTDRYKNHRFPVEIISHAVWLYFRFCLSLR